VLVFFSLPLFAVGGSVQALTRAPWLTLPCWVVAAACMHLFARPTHHLHLHLLAAAPEAPGTLSDALRHPAFVRMGAVFLGVAVGPLLAVVAVSTVLWNR
jgi:hypothetical protein